MVALTFILQSGAVMAGQPHLVDPDGGGYADERTMPTPEQLKEYESADSFLQIGGQIDEFMNPVTQQGPQITEGQLIFESPSGTQYVMLTGETDPVEDYYQPIMKLFNPEQELVDVVEPELEIYKWDPQNCEEVYFTSFEDNAANYMEWAQIDGDAADIGTYYDGWAWSDARACTGDHSFKSTMYDEYKNMQDDYIYMQEVIDVSEYSTITVHFNTFVAGEGASWYNDYWAGDIYNPLDFLEFGIIDDGTMYFVDNGDGQVFSTSDGYTLPGNYYFFDTSIPLYSVEDPGYDGMDYTNKAEKIDGCPGWWHVWLDFPVSGLITPGEFGVWFGFHSDKERVFEGAYIDDILIEGCIPDGEKIYQGHSQDWLTIDPGVTYFEFPLVWDDVEPGTYKAVAKVKNDEGGYDDWDEIIFEIADNIDCAIVDMFVEDDFTGEIIPDGGIMSYTADAHIPFTYHNTGNVAMEGVGIRATGYKVVKETLFEDDMEGMSNWVYFYEDAPLYMSNDFAWSGSQSLAFNNPDTMHYDNDKFYVGYSQAGWNMEDVEECQIDMYIKAKLADAGEQFVGCMLTYNLILGYILIDSGPRGDNGWVGPMQPQCQYYSVDFDYQFNRIADIGYFYDDNGHMTYDTGIGFWLQTDATGVFFEDETDWSGVYVDDIVVTATTVGEKVWEDTMVLPGPCEPSETCSGQFTWEDVPYCNYKVCVEALCEGDVNDDNNMICSTFNVLEPLEKPAKPEGVDYTECTDEAWCISNVIGAGDHYALATNCDTFDVPAGVNDFIALAGEDDECCPGAIDISHLETGEAGAAAEVIWTDDMSADTWTVVSDGNAPTWEYTTLDPNICVPGGASGYRYAIDDDGAGSGAPASVDDLVSPAIDCTGYSNLELEFHGDFQWVSSTDFMTVNVWDGAMWHEVAYIQEDVGGFDAWSGFPIDISVADGNSDVQIMFTYDDGGAWAWGAQIDNVVVSGAPTVIGGGAKYTVLTSGFETWTGPLPEDFQANTGWTDSTWGFPHSGLGHAWCGAAGATLTTNTVTLEQDSELRFWYAAEYYLYPMDLEIYCNGDFMGGIYGWTEDTVYTEFIVDLSAYDFGPATIEFVHLNSDLYGACLDDVLITTEEEQQGPVLDEMILDMHYQCDLYTDSEVILEVAGFTTGSAMWRVEMYDDYGDGWDAGHYIEVWVNDVQVGVVDLASGTFDFFEFEVMEGDLVKACYINPGPTSYAEEQSWALINHEGLVLFIDGNLVDGEAPESSCAGPYTMGECAGCPVEECPAPAGLDAWTEVAVFTGNAPGIDQYFTVDLVPYLIGYDHFFIRFRLDTTYWEGSAYAGPGIGFHLHEITIFDMLADGDFYEDFEDGNMINEDAGLVWCSECVTWGEYWEEVDTHAWEQAYPAEPINNALVWSTEIEDAYEAMLTGMWTIEIAGGATVTFELSADGGENWFIIANEEGPLSYDGPIPCTPFDLTPWAGSEILIRTRVVSDGTAPGYVKVYDLAISGKQDRVPPTATISLSGNMIGPGLYAGPVTVTINANDDAGMGEIHYILDGSESIVSGDKATFKVSNDGDHTVEFWAVDATGNEGAHGTASFSVDATPPTVAITAPEPGLYLFGSKLLSMSKPFIIVAFTIEATADDAQGIYVVQFLLNGEVIGEDTEAPYDAYCAVKNMGAGTIKAIALDGVGNSAEDTLDVTYYKFL